MMNKKTVVNYLIGVLIMSMILVAIMLLLSFFVIKSLNYLFPVLQIPIDFWSICSMIFLLMIFNQRHIAFNGNKDN